MLLEVKNIVKEFPVRRGFFGRPLKFIRAVDGVSLNIKEGEIFGLVGESGCGKTTLGRIVIGLCRPTEGEIVFNGSVKDHQIVFQDPSSSLNPRMTAGDIISEPMIVHRLCRRKDRFSAAATLLEAVGLDPESANRYPHEFSGGQKQRICIARAISTRPKLIVADEPVSSLDVAVQAEILLLLKELKLKYNVAYLFISHDLRVVASFCDRVAVMYEGKIVEELPARDLKKAQHSYTKRLLAALPKGRFA